jgi:uncharacterized repeat protein (TIGR01451 family)
MNQRASTYLFSLTVVLVALLALFWGVSGAAGNLATNTNFNELEVDLGIQFSSEPRPAFPGNEILYTVSVTGLVSATAAGQLTSAALVMPIEAVDPNPGNNFAEDVNQLFQIADLRVNKSAQPTTVVAGQLLTYTVTVLNLGPTTATNVTMTDTLPSMVTFTSVNDPNCAASADLVICQWDELTAMPGVNWLEVRLVVTVDVTATGNLVNRADVSSDAPDPNLGNNTAFAVTTVIPPNADLVVTKSANLDTAVAGQPLTYTLNMTNSGPSDATNVVLTDTLPSQVSFTSISDPACEEDAGIVTCAWAELEAGQEIEVSLVVAVDIAASGSLINEVEVSSDTPDPNPDNNEFELTTPIAAAVADLSVSKSGLAAVTAGEMLTYTLTVANDGPATAANVILTDTLPTQTTFVSIDNANCGLNAGLVVCSWDELAVNEEIELSLVVAVAATARNPLVNQVQVRSATPDLHPANNQDQTTTTVNAVAALSLSKTVAPTTVTGQAPFIYTLTLANDGPSAALATVLTDEWPASLELVSGPAQCTLVGSVLTCNLGTVQPDQELVLSLTAQATAVDPVSDTVYSNLAVANSDAGQSNQASASVTVRPYRLFLPATLKPDVWQQVGNLPAGVTAFYDIAFCWILKVKPEACQLVARGFYPWKES